jgi:hypothetical protein
MIYEELSPLTKEEAETELGSGNAEKIAVTLLRLSLQEEDWRWVTSLCTRFIDHQSAQVRNSIATAIGHLVRIHRRMDQEIVFPMLKKLLQDPETHGKADDALDDISTFLGLDKERLLSQIN